MNGLMESILPYCDCWSLALMCLIWKCGTRNQNRGLNGGVCGDDVSSMALSKPPHGRVSDRWCGFLMSLCCAQQLLTRFSYHTKMRMEAEKLYPNVMSRYLHKHYGVSEGAPASLIGGQFPLGCLSCACLAICDSFLVIIMLSLYSVCSVPSVCRAPFEIGNERFCKLCRKRVLRNDPIAWRNVRRGAGEPLVIPE